MISIIVAAAGKKRVIGQRGGMPWYIPSELKKFKEITMGHPIIMGRKTHQSIGKALPGRTNIVVTRGKGQGESEIVIANSLEEAVKKARMSPGSEEIFIIGGGQIYEQAIHLADKLYLTYVEKQIEGDVFFPDYSQFKKTISESDWQVTEGRGKESIRYKFLELAR